MAAITSDKVFDLVLRHLKMNLTTPSPRIPLRLHMDSMKFTYSRALPVSQGEGWIVTYMVDYVLGIFDRGLNAQFGGKFKGKSFDEVKEVTFENERIFAERQRELWEDKRVVDIEVGFVVTLFMEEKPSEEEIQDFVKAELYRLTHDNLREILHNYTQRMGIPTLTLEVFVG